MGRKAHKLDYVFEGKIVCSNGCWLFGQKGRCGKRNEYGKITINSVTYRAHVAAYLAVKGEYDRRLHLAHSCHTPLCINPDHVSPQAPYANILDSNSPAAINARKTHCPQGHEYTEANTMRTGQGRRVCKQCRKDYFSSYVRA